MICLLHGWLLEGSGSNLWTRSIIQSLCRSGETVHLVCQENHPERYDFISEAWECDGGDFARVYQSDTAYDGQCIMYKPRLHGPLPVFVWDKYEEHSEVIPMIDLPDEVLENYISRNAEVARAIVAKHSIPAIHANHAVLMPTVALRVKQGLGTPFTVMPHGSDIEYAVRKERRFLLYASDAMAEAGRVFLIGDEMRRRVMSVFRDVPDLEAKLRVLHLGVDTARFRPAAPEERSARINAMLASLDGLPRGRTVDDSARLESTLENLGTPEALDDVLRSGKAYDAKTPDAGLEEKLSSVSWESSPTVLFVGRLIAAKGIQSLLAALPSVLERLPTLRMVVVGHGPQREIMEAFLWALRTGRREILETIVQRGRELEGSAHEDSTPDGLNEVASYFAELDAAGKLENYLRLAQTLLQRDTVVFTGYLTHRELSELFPCCDVGVFPSVVTEAGPLVFLEALSSGCFPVGTYLGGMAASIDALSGTIPDAARHLMKLDPANTARDLAAKLPDALAQARVHGAALSQVARERYDWSRVSSTFAAELHSLAAAG